MSRWLRPAIVGALLSGSLAFSCIVSNVELVDRLPGSSDGGAGVAGTTNSTDGGDDPGPSGGKSSGGSGAGRAGSGDPGGGSSNPGGGGSNPGGSSGGGDGPVTDPTTWEFSGKGACETSIPPMLCDDFEQDSATNWAGGLPGMRPVVADAPSGQHIWRSAYMSAAMNLTPGGAGFNLSFWVRLPDGGDRTFIHWSGPGHTLLSFGVEGGAYRFRLASEPVAYSAPELQKYTRNVRFDQWTCVELVYVDATFQATVTVLGEAPVKLALVGGAADTGIDEEILEQGASDAFDIGPEWTLGETGAELDFDDVRVVPIGQPSVCQEFIDANSP